MTAASVLLHAVPLLVAIVAHEAAHAYAADRLGDPTPRLLGRCTLDATQHIDLIGTILLPAVVAFLSAGALLFGYAKPVPVNPQCLRDPVRGLVLVALAGPAANLLQAAAWAAVLYAPAAVGLQNPGILVDLARAGVVANLAIAAFNLLPIRPLDGWLALSALTRRTAQRSVQPPSQGQQDVRRDPPL